ncbi:efflux RND transporter periplasmic adaptor subunit [Aureimonas psammosilenae]|uniref:efflux RND transporter periplasmic adaptor subunit n=1 Tax=Aureimonas psammosilenae TaxID=2495496 RepID=UPI001F1C2BBF|nr:efflux RND transporter periplasmic adaptor subunit [Aureimonas psammosilenae]
MRSSIPFIGMACAACLLAGCGEHEAPPPPVRPVLSVRAEPTAVEPASFAGSVQPRYSRDLAFRVLGRVTGRNVDVGDTIAAGQLLASLDQQAQALSVRSLEGDLAAAEAQLENAKATRDRQAALVRLNASPQAQLDTAEQQFATAQSTVINRRSDLAKAREELSYTRLVSETNGIVTGVSVEVGQIASVGQTAVTVAQADVREAVIDVAEDMVGSLSVGQPFTVTLQIDPRQKVRGSIREIAPSSDAATRSRRVRITLADPSPAFRLGTTVDARMDVGDDQAISLPKTALLRTKDSTFVWVVDEAKSTVSKRAVTIASEEGSVVHVASGLEPGMRVVTAGAYSLKDGQSVKTQQELAL